MEWQFVLLIVLVIPFMLIPVVFVWYLNASGLFQVIRDARRRQSRRVAREKESRTATEIAK